MAEFERSYLEEACDRLHRLRGVLGAMIYLMGGEHHSHDWPFDDLEDLFVHLQRDIERIVKGLEGRLTDIITERRDS